MKYITLNVLADRARNKDWNITQEESIQIWELIPEGCRRRGVICDKRGKYIEEDHVLFIVNGLGAFRIR